MSGLWSMGVWRMNRSEESRKNFLLRYSFVDLLLKVAPPTIFTMREVMKAPLKPLIRNKKKALLQFSTRLHSCYLSVLPTYTARVTYCASPLRYGY